MRAPVRYIFVIVLWLGLLSPVVARDGSDLATLLRSPARPSAQQVLRIQEDSLRSYLGDPDALDARSQKIYELYKIMIAELRAEEPNSVILILGRDGEEFFDAYSAVADSREAARLHLFNASRPLVRNSSDAALLRYMQSHGMNIDAILAGRQRVVWIDSGSRGSIYISLLAAIIRQIRDDDPQRAQKIRNVFQSISPRLIVAWGTPSAAHFAEEIINNRTSNDNVLNFMFMRLFFEQIPRSGRTKFGMDGDDASKRRWVVDHIEHIPKWGPRTLRVNDAGVVEYEAPEPHINKEAYLLNQARVVRHFSRSDISAAKPVARVEEVRPAVVSAVEPVSLPDGDVIEDFAPLLKTLREHPSIDVQSQALERIVEMTSNHKLYPQIIAKFGSSARFAHVVHKYAEMFDRRFLTAYYEHVRTSGFSEGAHIRLMRSCEKLFEK